MKRNHSMSTYQKYKRTETVFHTSDLELWQSLQILLLTEAYRRVKLVAATGSSLRSANSS